MKPSNEINELITRKHVLVTYLHEKLKEQDWHGVMDASADIREIEAKLSVLK